MTDKRVIYQEVTITKNSRLTESNIKFDWIIHSTLHGCELGDTVISNNQQSS